MRRFGLLLMIAFLLVSATNAFAQQGKGNDCTIAGVWYGGSVVAYKLTIIPAGPAGHYITIGEGMYKNSVMSTTFSGEAVKNGDKYEGTLMGLNTQDPQYLNPPPFTALPDIAVGWTTVEMLDCNTVRNTIPFYGIYFGPPSPAGSGIWQPGTPSTGMNWVVGGKRPLLDPPDVDLIPILTGDTKPIIETYHRVPLAVNPTLLHQ